MNSYKNVQNIDGFSPEPIIKKSLNNKTNLMGPKHIELKVDTKNKKRLSVGEQPTFSMV